MEQVKLTYDELLGEITELRIQLEEANGRVYC